MKKRATLVWLNATRPGARSLRLRLVVASIALLACAGLAGAQQMTVLTSEHGPNSAEQQKKHYVILVSLDGFRYDYAEKYHAEHIAAMARAGATAPQGMIPAYPSLTFPNHYTLATGLYPEHHG